MLILKILLAIYLAISIIAVLVSEDAMRNLKTLQVLIVKELPSKREEVTSSLTYLEEYRTVQIVSLIPVAHFLVLGLAVLGRAALHGSKETRQALLVVTYLDEMEEYDKLSDIDLIISEVKGV